MTLKGRTALVTGAARGIGRASALALAEAGCDLVLNDLPSAETEALTVVAAIEELGRRAIFLPGDVADYALVHSLAEQALRTMGRIDILVNNAGVSMPKRLVDMTEADWDRTLNTDLKSMFNWCHALVPGMLEARWGRIINLSSAVAKYGGDFMSVSKAAYAAAKSGVLGFTRGLAREVAPYVTVNAICPGLVETPGSAKLIHSPAGPDALRSIPLNRFGRPEDIAQAILYLATADWVTGEVMDVNGGHYID